MFVVVILIIGYSLKEVGNITKEYKLFNYTVSDTETI